MTDRLAHPAPPNAPAAPVSVAARATPAPRPDRAHTPTDDDARDLALITAHKAGDPTALTELLTKYQDRLFAVCLRMIGNQDHAADLLQDAMVRIIAGIHTFNANSKLSTWMIRIAMNACLTELRRRKLRKHASLDAPGGGGSNNHSGGGEWGGRASIAATLSDPGEHSPLQSVVMEDDRRRLFRALSGLDPEQRAILILRDAQGLDYRRIAEVLDIPEGTVKSRLFRSRFALRQEMERLEAQPDESSGATE
ncbi:MAG: sigma-70 family RNA polymerase sigma factor [Phycisphaerales bacterium]